jgi:fibronectin-binding autotransporter adhesin
MGIFRRAGILLLAAAAFSATNPAFAQLDPNAFTSLGTLNVSTGTLNINTDTLAVTGAAMFTGVALNQNGGPQVAVFDFNSITIGSGVTVNVSGSRAIALLSRNAFTVQPTINFVSSVGALGGFQGGGVLESSTIGDQENEAGFGPGGGYAFGSSAGGGGYGGLGGVTSGAAAGLTYGNLFQTLQGGGGGGASAAVNSPGASAVGGSGGGAIEMVAVGALSVGSITTKGVTGTSNNSSTASGAGGAGGGILLSGSTVSVTGILDASAGNGAGLSAGGGGGGRIALSGIGSYTLGGSSVTFNLNGGNSTGSGSVAGLAGVLTLAPVSTTVPTGKTIVLDGTAIPVVAGSVTQTNPTIEVYIRNDLVVNSGATVSLGIDNLLNHLNSSGVNVTAITNNGIFNTNGFSQTIDTLSGTTTTASLSLSAGSTLTVGANNGSGSYVGAMSGTGTLIKEGSGTQTLGGTNTNYSGSIFLTGGTLTASNTNALINSTLNLAGGTLNFSGIQSASIGAIAGSSNFPVSGMLSLTVGNNNASTNYSGNLSGTIISGINKIGTGTWTLSGTNTQSGALNIQGGTVVMGSVGALSPSSAISISSGATLDLNDFNDAITSTSNSLSINGTVRNGSISGTGTVTLGANGVMSAISTSSSATVTQTGAATVVNFTNGGQFTNSASQALTWSNGTVTSPGRLTVSGTVNSTDFTSDGVVTMNSTGTINNTLSNLYLGGGSRTTINAGGHLTTASGTTIELDGGLLVNNGTITGTTDVNYGSLAKGTGTYGVVNVSQGGTYAPGNSPGIVTAAAVNFDSTPVSSGAATLQIELAGTTPGSQYDQLHVTGQLSLGGELQVLTLPGFTPSQGNSFDIMDWGTLSGKFSELDLPSLSAGLSWSTLQLYTTGTLRVANSTLLYGDFNRDGVVTAADIAPMEQALADLQGYAQSHGGLTGPQVATIGDVNGDGVFNIVDLQMLLLDLKSGGGSTNPVPEPSALVLAGIAAAALAIARFRGRYRMPATVHLT